MDDIAFQKSGEKLSVEEADDEISLNEAYGQFKIRKKVSPPPIPYQDDKKEDLLVWCLSRDIGLVLASAVGQKCSGILDSFLEESNFKKDGKSFDRVPSCCAFASRR